MFDLTTLLETVGYIGFLGIIFAESGLFFGFFLPGDSLLFTAGILSSQNYFNIYLIVFIAFIGAVLGDNFGYAFGRRVGPAIFKKDNSLFFHKQHLERAKTFYEKYGKKTIILARFIPIVRTFAPILAGVGKMNYTKFLIFNIIGGLVWGVGVTLIGYFLGNAILGIDRYLFPIILFIILTSILPIAFELFKKKEGSS